MANLPTDLSTKANYRPALGGRQAADYILEQRVQKRYRWLLRESIDGPIALDEFLQTCFPLHFQGKHRDRCQVFWQAEERVEHYIPEVLSQVTRIELEQVATLLDAGDLVAATRLVWEEFRPQLHKLAPAESLPDDSRQYRAAGLGALSRGLCNRKTPEAAFPSSTQDLAPEVSVIASERTLPGRPPTPVVPPPSPTRPQLRPRKEVSCQTTQ